MKQIHSYQLHHSKKQLKGKVDKLEGLKENVIIGKLIPAGTGVKKYRNTEFTLEKEFFDEEPLDVLEEELL